MSQTGSNNNNINVPQFKFQPTNNIASPVFTPNPTTTTPSACFATPTLEIQAPPPIIINLKEEKRDEKIKKQ